MIHTRKNRVIIIILLLSLLFYPILEELTFVTLKTVTIINSPTKKFKCIVVKGKTLSHLKTHYRIYVLQHETDHLWMKTPYLIADNLQNLKIIWRDDLTIDIQFSKASITDFTNFSYFNINSQNLPLERVEMVLKDVSGDHE